MKRLLWSSAFVALLVGGTAATASAAPILTLISGGNEVTINDNGAATCVSGSCGTLTGDVNPTNGSIAVVGDFGGFSFTSTSGTSSAPGCNPVSTDCLADNTIVATSTQANANVTILFADSGFVASPGYRLTFSSPGQFSPGSVATQSAFSFGGTLGPNLSVPVSGQIGSTITSNVPGLVAASTFGTGDGGGNLLLATVLTAPTIGSTFQTTANLSAVPEPASMMLLGTGLFGLAGAARRRLRRARA